MLRPYVLLLLAVLVTFSPAAAAWGQLTATIERLPVPPGDTQAEGHAISSDGKTVVGFSGTHQSFAYRWKDGAYLSLGFLPTSDRSEAFAVSGDGSVVVGSSRTSSNERAFRWTAAGMEALPIADPFGRSAAYAISDDGRIIVGDAPFPFSQTVACYWDETGVHSIGTLQGPQGTSVASAVSADGTVIVGKSTSPETFFYGRAFRWENNVMQDLGSLDGSTGTSEAYGVSADGKVVVGESKAGQNRRAFRWTEGEDLQELETPVFHSAAYDVSDDGRTIVGMVDQISPLRGDACLWVDGNAISLWDLLESDYGIDLQALGWEYFGPITSCSADGRVLIGSGGYWPAGRYQSPIQGAPFRVVLPRLNAAPTLTSAVAEASTLIAAAESTFLATFRGQDADDDEELTLEVAGLPPGATMTPIAGTKGPGTPAAPFLATLEWTPTAAHVGSSFPVTISFRDSFGVVVSRSFTINVRSNVKPTVAALDPKTIECVNGQHFVELSTVVADADADPLTVTWTVGGVVKKTQPNVPSGSTVTFEANYAHGAHSIVVEASDGFAKGTAGTTVTVEDTKDPTIVVAGDVRLTTDPGKPYASKARLALPTAQDGSGHPVTLTSDAPTQFPLGESTVVWTATDGAGHQALASQRVVVVDEEKPSIAFAPALVLYCDPGRTYRTRTLTPPKVSDNVPVGITIRKNVGTRFGIGVHRVLWTATDSFGNVAQRVQSVTVVNRKPKANAGKDRTILTTSPRGLRLPLNGSGSSDPDKHKLKFAWKATKGVRLIPGNVAKPAGMFPVGTTTVTLTVTDAAGAKHSDVMKVTVKLKSRRPRGSAADRSFVAATQQAEKSQAAKRPSGPALAGIAYAKAASAYGSAAGAFERPEESPTEADALLAYAQLRAVQQAYGQAAAGALLSAYAETGDENLLSAYGSAAYGSAYAAADLQDR